MAEITTGIEILPPTFQKQCPVTAKSTSTSPAKSSNVFRTPKSALVMPHEIKIPALGESVTGGQISKWNFKDGDYVKTGDILLVLETDKVAAEVTAEASGTLTISKHVDDEVEIGAVVGQIDESAAAPAAKTAEAPQPAAPAAAAPAPAPEAKPASAPEVKAAPPPVAAAKAPAPAA